MAISGIVPLTVDFTNTSVGENLSYSWDFGDGQTSMEASPSHTYEVVGEYTVTLTTTNNYGTDTKLDSISVSLGVSTAPFPSTEPQLPVAGATAAGAPAGIYQYGAAGGPPVSGGPPGGPGGNGKGKGTPSGVINEQGPPAGIYQYGAAGGPPDEK